jgi:hypothetical protein
MLFETLAIGCPPTASVLPVFWTLPNVVGLTWIKVGHAPGRRSFDLDQSSSLPLLFAGMTIIPLVVTSVLAPFCPKTDEVRGLAWANLARRRTQR